MAASVRDKLSKSRKQVRALKEMSPQGSLRRVMGDVLATGAAYGGSMGVIELQKAGIIPAFPIDVIATSGLRFLGAMRWLGGASDVVHEATSGHVDGRVGQMTTLMALQIRLVNGKFVNSAGDPIPLGE